MKRLVLYMVTLVLALALFTCTALAATNWETLQLYFEQVRDMKAAGELEASATNMHPCSSSS